MCKCTPNIRKPFCGKPGCEWPKQSKSVEQEENELICERLLGWKRASTGPLPDDVWTGLWYTTRNTNIYRDTPFFTDWDSAGLILEVLTERGLMPHLFCARELWACTTIENAVNLYYRDTGPLAIRAAALAHIRSLP